MKFVIGEIALLWNPAPDFSHLHGEEVLIEDILPNTPVGPLYEFSVRGVDHCLYAHEYELKKLPDNGKELTTTWDECVWSPYTNKETEDV